MDDTKTPAVELKLEIPAEYLDRVLEQVIDKAGEKMAATCAENMEKIQSAKIAPGNLWTTEPITELQAAEYIPGTLEEKIGPGADTLAADIADFLAGFEARFGRRGISSTEQILINGIKRRIEPYIDTEEKE